MKRGKKKSKGKTRSTGQNSSRGKQSAAATIPRLGYDDIQYRSGSSPFANFSTEKMDEMFSDLATNAEQKYQESLKALIKLIAGTSPRRMLAFFAMYGLTMREGHPPELFQDNPILPHHVEVMQALALRRPLEEYPKDALFLGANADEAHRLVKEVTETFSLRRIRDVRANSEGHRRRAAAIESIRMSTLAIRNWAFPNQMKRILRDLYAPLEEAIRAELHVTVRDLLVFFDNLIGEIEQRLNNYRAKLRPALQAVVARTA